MIVPFAARSKKVRFSTARASHRSAVTTWLCVLVLCIAPAAATVYSSGPRSGVENAGGARPSGVDFPQPLPKTFIDDAGADADFAALLNSVGEFFGRDKRSTPAQTVASLYESPTVEQAETPVADKASTVRVNVWNSTGHPDPINVFTGANTREILSQLFSGILNVDDATFANRRKNGRGGRLTFPSGHGGGLARTGSRLGDGGFLSLQTFVEKNPAQQSWIGSTPISREFPTFADKKRATSDDFMDLVMKVFNPYFYGGVVLVVLFSIAWSMRSRLAADRDIDS